MVRPDELVAARYRLGGALADGAGTPAWDERLRRTVALHPAGHGPEALARALAEARLVSRLHQTGVVPVYDVLEDDGLVLLVRPVLAGRPLARALADGPLPAPVRDGVLAQVRATLADLHRLRTTHGRIGPDTVLLLDDGSARVGGLDAAVRHDDDAALAAAGAEDLRALQDLRAAFGSAAADPAPTRSRRSLALACAGAGLAAAVAGVLVLQSSHGAAPVPSAGQAPAALGGHAPSDRVRPAATPAPRASSRAAAGGRSHAAAHGRSHGAVTPPAAPPTPATEPPASSPPTTAADSGPAAALLSYYTLMPGDLQAGWQRMTPAYRRVHAGGTQGYRAFWSQIRAVQVRSVRSAGDGRAEATIVYHFRDGHVVTEDTVFDLVRRRGSFEIAGSTVESSISR